MTQSETKALASKIIDTTIKRLNKYNNRTVVLNPLHKSWRPIIRAERPIPAHKELFKLAEKKQYNERFMAVVHIFSSKENAELRVQCNLVYFKKGKKRASMSFGDVICFLPQEVIKYSLTTERLLQLVKKMHNKGQESFRGIRKRTYKNVLHVA